MTYSAQASVAVASVLIIAGVFVVVSPHVQSTAKATELDMPTELALIPVRYSQDAHPSSHIPGNGQCTPGQNRMIRDAVTASHPAITRAVAARGSPYFTKWFGQATPSQPDSDVYTRLSRALDKYDNTNDWEAECCPVSGSTDTQCATNCKAGTLAFVNSATRSDFDGKISFNSIRFCPGAFELESKQLGFTIFHESLHLTSGAGDGNGDYDKVHLVQLAKKDPALARLTANSYTLYAIQAGYEDYKEYEQVSAPWGGSTTDGTCFNGASNCYKLVRAGNCATDRFSDGKPFTEGCCEACKRLQPPGTVVCRDKYANCGNMGPNKAATTSQQCKSGTLQGGEFIGSSCCKTCEQFNPTPAPTNKKKRGFLGLFGG